MGGAFGSPSVPKVPKLFSKLMACQPLTSILWS